MSKSTAGTIENKRLQRVVRTAWVTAGKWTHWGELIGVDYNSEFIIHHSELGNGASSGVILSGAEGEVEGSLTKYSVTISGLDLTQARALQANYPGSEIRKGTE